MGGWGPRGWFAVGSPLLLDAILLRGQPGRLGCQYIYIPSTGEPHGGPTAASVAGASVGGAGAGSRGMLDVAWRLKISRELFEEFRVASCSKVEAGLSVGTSVCECVSVWEAVCVYEKGR